MASKLNINVSSSESSLVSDQTRSSESEKKKYISPNILSAESLELAAVVCSPQEGTGKTSGLPENCGTPFQPFSS